MAVSQAQADWFVARNLCRASKVMTIRSCVDLSPFRAIPSTIGPLRTFAAIGRLDRQKGFDRLIEAFKSIPNPDFALHIYGQGDQEAALRDLAEGDSRIVFKGFAATPTAAYENIDAVIMPSRWEAYGLVAIEALSAGRALLCADTDGMRDHAKLGARMLKDPSLSGLRAELDRIAALGHEMPASPCRFSDRLERDFAAGWRNVAALAKVQPELGLQPVAGGRA